MITDTNDLIRSTNKALSNEYNKEFKQYSKEDSKVYLVILGIIDNKIITPLEHKKTARGCINYLKQTFKAYSLIYKPNVQETFIKLRFQLDLVVTTFLSRY